MQQINKIHNQVIEPQNHQILKARGMRQSNAGLDKTSTDK